MISTITHRLLSSVQPHRHLTSLSIDSVSAERIKSDLQVETQNNSLCPISVTLLVPDKYYYQGDNINETNTQYLSHHVMICIISMCVRVSTNNVDFCTSLYTLFTSVWTPPPPKCPYHNLTNIPFYISVFTGTDGMRRKRCDSYEYLPPTSKSN